MEKKGSKASFQSLNLFCLGSSVYEHCNATVAYLIKFISTKVQKLITNTVLAPAMNPRRQDYKSLYPDDKPDLCLQNPPNWFED